jgi:murein DD-endopeptidase MepM/ murein hydrolase activator NlpD
MPVVPILNENQVRERGSPDARFRPADFGEGAEMVGRSVERLGKIGAQVAEEQDKINQQLDTAGAKNLDLEWSNAARTIKTNFLATQGLNAGTERPNADKALDELSKTVLAKATTPRMKEILRQSIEQRRTITLSDFDTHLTSQMAKATEDAARARQVTSAENAVAAASDQERRTEIETGKGEIRALAKQQGWDAARTSAEEFRYESSIHASVALNMIDADDVSGAQSYLEKNKDRIGAADEAKIVAALKEPLQAREARGLADEVMGVATAQEGNSINYADPLRGAGRTPVPGGQFGAGRDYGSHKGVDMPAPAGSPVFSTAPGTARVSRSEKGGLTVTIDHGSGIVSRYMHLGSTSVQDGDRVTPDTMIGKVGMTGRSTGPHLHWEVLQDGKATDPKALVGRVAQSPQTHDLNTLLARADRVAAERGLSPEATERMKREIERRVQRDETLLARRERDAERAALDKIDEIESRGGKFTSPSQLGSLWEALPPDTRLRLRDQAAANAKPSAPVANGTAALTLNLMAAYNPDQFAATDLRLFKDQLTPAEFESLAVQQAKERKKVPEAADHSRIWGQINRAAPDLGLDLGESKGKARDPEARADAMRIFETMRGTLNAVTGGKRQPTDDEIKAAFDSAVLNVKVTKPGWFGDKTVEMPRFKADGAYRVAVPNTARDRIIDSYRRQTGRAPDESTIAQTYLRFRGQPGFWN